jgi:hypothetical protein
MSEFTFLGPFKMSDLSLHPLLGLADEVIE